MKDDLRPWRFLDAYRGSMFEGDWPTLKQMFKITVRRYSDRRCWTSFGAGGLTLTYGEADHVISRVSEYLLSIGVTKDSHICVCGRNTPEWAIAFMAAVYCGCTVIPLDSAINQEDAEKLITFGDVDYFFGDADRVDYARPFVKGVFCLERGRSDEYIMDLRAEVTPPLPYEAQSSDVAAILFTSGTTGMPKGVMLTHDNLVSCCYQAQANMNISCKDVFYAILPIHHAYTLQAVFIESMSVGAEVIFGKKLVIARVLKEMKDGKVTMFLGVPMLFNKMIQGLMKGVREKGPFIYGLIKGMMAISGFFRDVLHIDFGKKLFRGLLAKLSLENVRICICGGGPLPMSTIRMYHQLGLDFVQGYGMTETSPITHLNPIYAFIKTSVGKNCVGIEQKIVEPDEEGNGLIYLRGSVVMKGYYKNIEATAEVLSSDGWLNTGDIGHIDSKGYLYLTGRAKNIIVSEGGKNISPEEIEDKFQLYGEIAQLCVIPHVKDQEKKIEEVRLLALPSQELINECAGDKIVIEKRINEVVRAVNNNLPAYKKIAMVTVIDTPLPETSTKKVKRGEVMKIYGKD